MSGARIFVSSTINDLVDLRAEVQHCIRDAGLVPVLSDIPDSGFEVSGFTGVIETCLDNLRRSDVVLVVLSHRYGKPLPDPFPEVSATHLEVRTALEFSDKPRFLFARKELIRDYHGKASAQSAVAANGANGGKDPRVFEIIDEMKNAYSGKDVGAWYDAFDTSFDLKPLILARLDAQIGEAAVARLLSRGEVPLMMLEARTLRESNENQWVLDLIFRNVSPHSAINLELTGDIALGSKHRRRFNVIGSGAGEGSKESPFSVGFSPVEVQNRWSKGGVKRLFVNLEYDIYQGFRIRDRYRCDVEEGPKGRIKSTLLIGRKYVAKASWMQSDAC